MGDGAVWGLGLASENFLGPHTNGGSPLKKKKNGRNPKVWNGEKSSKLKLLISSFLCLSWEHWHEFLSSFFRFLFSRICSTSRPHPKGWFQCCFIYLMLRYTSLVKAFWLFSSMNSFCNRIKGEWPFPNPTFSVRSPLWWCETCPTSTPSRCCHETQLWWETFGICWLWLWCHLPWDWNATKDDMPSTN